MAGWVRSFIFGRGESRDERLQRYVERLQRYEDLVDQDYERFHDRCTFEEDNVPRTKRGLIATRRLLFVIQGAPNYANEIVFSAKSIPVGTMFQVKLLELIPGLMYTSSSFVSACTEYSTSHSLAGSYSSYWTMLIYVILGMLGCNGVNDSIIQIREQQCVTAQREIPDQVAPETGFKSMLI